MFSALLGKSGSPSAVNPFSTLQLPSVASRCSHLRNCIATLPIKELHQFFPHLLSNIFGFDGRGGWGLRGAPPRGPAPHHLDPAQQVLQFLSAPQGELFRLVSRLEAEGFLYEFPTSYLPRPSQQSLSEGVVPSFYSNKVQLSLSMDTTPAHVSLSALELYFFHFAYFLVAAPLLHVPGGVPASSPSPVADSLYSHLLDAYLTHYLPHTGTVPTLTPLTSSPPPHHHHHSPLQYSSYHHHGNLDAANTPPSARFSVSSGSSLFSGGLPSPPSPPSPPHSLLKHSADRQHTLLGPSGRGHAETTPTEVLVQTLVEFWLNQNSYNEGHGELLLHAQNLYFLNEEHLLLLRRLLKQIHYFSNGCTTLPTSIPSPLTPITDSLRCCILDVELQKKLYLFLHYSLKHSPLDTNFRYLLEVWLTYIQPWRYLDPSRPSTENKESLEALPERWRAFVLHAFPFYSSLLVELLSRCLLTTNTLSCLTLLYRVTKVFSQPGLMGFIEYGESLLVGQEQQQQQVVGGGARLVTGATGHSPLSGSSSLRALLLELGGGAGGGAYHSCPPVFHPNTTQAVQALMMKLCYAKASLLHTGTPSPPSHHHHSPQLSPASPQAARKRSYWQQFVELFSDDGPSSSSYPHTLTPPPNHRRLVEQIDIILSYLAHMFKISIPVLRPPPGDGSPVLGRAVPLDTPLFGYSPGQTSGAVAPECLTPEYERGSPLLTPEGRKQLISGVCKSSPVLQVGYRGDPVLQPIRSYENATLVRVLYQLSCYLNQRFSPQLSSIASSQRLWGHLLLQLLTAPPPSLTPSPLHHPHHTDSPPHTPVDRVSLAPFPPPPPPPPPPPSTSTPNTPHPHPIPRIDLRTFGSYYTLSYLVSAVLVVWLLSVPLWLVIVVLLLVVLLYCCAAYYHSGGAHTYRATGGGRKRRKGTTAGKKAN